MEAKPSIARTSRKPIRCVTTVKTLIESIQNCIRFMQVSPISLEEVCSNWPFILMGNGREVFFIKDLPMTFKCHCIGEENRSKNSLLFQTPDEPKEDIFICCYQNRCRHDKQQSCQFSVSAASVLHTLNMFSVELFFRF